MRRLRAVTVLLLTALVAGCGWHLRGAGSASLDGKSIAVVPDMGEGDLARSVRRELSRLGATPVKKGAGAYRLLTLVDEGVSRKTIATDNRGRATAYELTYRLTFSIADGEGQTLLDRQTVTADGTYQAQPLDTLAEQSQRDRLTRDLREEAVTLMLSRLARAGS